MELSLPAIEEIAQDVASLQQMSMHHGSGDGAAGKDADHHPHQVM